MVLAFKLPILFRYLEQSFSTIKPEFGTMELDDSLGAGWPVLCTTNV